jgi:hypothetical protein
MEMELVCRDCSIRFAAPADTPEEEVVQRMTDEGPWCALGEGDCFRTMVETALERRGRIRCPDCGGTMRLGDVALCITPQVHVARA